MSYLTFLQVLRKKGGNSIMRILLVHQHFSTPEQGGAIRSFHLASFLQQDGHEVIVITRRNGIKHPEIKKINGFEVHYLPVEYANEMSFVKRFPAYLSFVIKTKRYLKTLSSQHFDLSYCISTPLTSGIIGLWLKKKYGVPFIFEVGDLWPDAPIAIKAIWFPPTKFFLKRLERWIYNHAKSIVGLSPPIAETIRKRTKTTVHYIPNMADTGYFDFHPKEPGPFTIVYFGTIGRANKLEFMLKVARESIIAELPLQFKIMGSGARLEAIKRKATELDLHNFEFLPTSNRKAVRELLNHSDAVYVSYKDLEILKTGSPNKFFDGLAAGKLMILNFSGWLGRFVEQFKCGFTYAPEQPEAFVRQILPYVKDHDLLRQAQANARSLAEEEFALKKWKSEFLHVISEK